MTNHITHIAGHRLPDDVPGHWETATCQETEELMGQRGLTVLAGFTDLSGCYSAHPLTYRVWGHNDDTPVVATVTHPGPDGTLPHRKPCQHARFLTGRSAKSSDPDD